MNRYSPAFLETLQPDAALDYLKEGNQRFVNRSNAKTDLLQQVEKTSGGQFPFATILSCMDSRAPVEHIFDLGIGDVFSLRVAGNVLNEDILGSMEFATQVVGSKLLLVLGHTACGAIKGACDHAELGHLTQLVKKVNPALERETTTQGDRSSHNIAFVNQVAALNVQLVIEQIVAQSPIISALVDTGRIRLVGGMYDIATGKVTFSEESTQA